MRYAQTTVGDSRSMSSRRSRSKIYLRYAQTTVADLGFAVRSVGISLGPGLVDFVDGPSLSADPPDLAAKAINDRSFGKAVKRKAESGRIRFYDEPIAEGDKSGAWRKAFRSQP